MHQAFRIIASLLIVALLIGVATDGVRAAAMTMAPEISMSGGAEMPDCDGCDGDDAMSAICTIVCTSGSAVAMGLPTAMPELVCPDRTVATCTARRVPAGVRAPPDTSPPRIIVLN